MPMRAAVARVEGQRLLVMPDIASPVEQSKPRALL